MVNFLIPIGYCLKSLPRYIECRIFRSINKIHLSVVYELYRMVEMFLSQGRLKGVTYRGIGEF